MFIVEDVESTLFVANLNYAVRTADLQDLFEPLGATRVSSIKQRDLKPYAFITFDKKEVAAKALEEKEGKDFMGRTLHISWAGKSGENRKTDRSSSRNKKEWGRSKIY